MCLLVVRLRLAMGVVSWPGPNRTRTIDGLIDHAAAAIAAADSRRIKGRGSRNTIISQQQRDQQNESKQDDKHGWCVFTCLIRIKMGVRRKTLGRPSRRIVFEFPSNCRPLACCPPSCSIHSLHFSLTHDLPASFPCPFRPARRRADAPFCSTSIAFHDLFIFTSNHTQ